MSNREFYLARAEQCARDADAATLDNVRDRNLTAQQAWLKMADRAQRTDMARATSLADKAKAATMPKAD